MNTLIDSFVLLVMNCTTDRQSFAHVSNHLNADEYFLPYSAVLLLDVILEYREERSLTSRIDLSVAMHALPASFNGVNSCPAGP